MSAHPIDPHIAVIARIHPQAAINYIEALHAIDAILAPRRPVAAIEASEYENIASNRASIESDIEAAIIETHPLPQIDIDPSPLTDDEIAYGQRIADNPEWDRPGIPLETVLANNATTESDRDVSPQLKAETSVMSNGVGQADSVGESARSQKRKSSASVTSSNRGVKRNPKAVQQVIDYLMRNPSDVGLKVAELTDKLKYDVRMKVGHSSVGKALSVMKANGQEKAS